MTKGEAKRRLLKGLAVSLKADVDRGDAWPHQDGNGNQVNEADSLRVDAAAEELIDEFLRRGLRRGESL